MVKAAPYTLTQQPGQKHYKTSLNVTLRVYSTIPPPARPHYQCLRTRLAAAVEEAESEIRTIHTLLRHLPHLAAFIPTGLPPSLQVIGVSSQRSHLSYSDDRVRWRGAPALGQETQ